MTEALQKIEKEKAPITRFEKALGGRQSVIGSLVIDSSPEIQRFVKLLLNPENDRMTLGELATESNITLTDLLRAYRNATLAKAQILAVNKIAEALPDVAADVMKRALPQPALCPVCRGDKPKRKNGEDQTCKTCDGTGKIHRSPSVQRQRLALEIAELLKPPKHGPALLAQFNINAAASPSSPTAPGSFEQMQNAVSHVLYGRGPVIDVTPAPEEKDE